MTFRNPIIGGNDSLVRQAMQSEGFVSGATGWRITRDGNAEFNSGIFRGDVTVGPDGMPQVEVGGDSTHGYIRLPTNRPIEDVPAEIQALVINEGDADETLRAGFFSPRIAGNNNGIGITMNSPAADDSTTEFLAVSSTAQAGLLFVTRTAILMQGDVTIIGSLTASNIQTGIESVSFTTDTSHVRTVTITEMPAAPSIVLPVISSGDGSTRNWMCRTDTYTTDSFRLLLSGPSAAWSDVDVRWLAIG